MLSKKILALLLMCIFIFFTGCGNNTETKEWLMQELELDEGWQADTGTRECVDTIIRLGDTESEDPLRICVDLMEFHSDDNTYAEKALEDFLFKLENTVGLEDVVIELLPSPYSADGIKEDNSVRLAALEQIQLEMMDGGGPDVFIMKYMVNIDAKNYSVDYDVKNCLFPYPQKAMEYGKFLPLDEYMENNTELTEWDKLTQPVLEAGRNSEGQQIIPLSYTFPLLCYPKSEWEHIPDKTYTWGDMLNHSTLLPHSLDLANCGSSQKFMDVSDSDIDIVTEFSNSPDYLEYIMGSFADFETEELGFTEEELLECVNDIISLEPKDNFEEFDDARETYVGVDLSERTFNKPMTFLPLYNVDGGVTAHIEEYAAINRNTEKPEEAFKVIDLLMSKYVQQWSSIYHDLLCLYRLIPMHEELFQESNPLVGNNYYMRQDNYEAFCKLREQITAANFKSEGTNMLSDLMSLCMYEESLEYEQKTVEEAVHEAYEEMQRRLRE